MPLHALRVQPVPSLARGRPRATRLGWPRTRGRARQVYTMITHMVLERV